VAALGGAAPQAPSSPGSAVLAEAEKARASGDVARAIVLYREALGRDPASAEGWWQLGTTLYDADDYAGAAEAFRRASELTPQSGTPLVMLGLSEFRHGLYDDALTHLERGRALGTTPDPQFRQVMFYHLGLLLLEKAEFERALEALHRLASDGSDAEPVVVALGQADLRVRPSDPRARSSPLSDAVLAAGAAERLLALHREADAEAAYKRLVVEHSGVPNVYYALGRYYVATRQPELARKAYEQEIANTPGHVPARLGIAAILAETDPSAALRYAEAAVRLNDRIPLGHYLLGSLLLHTSDTARAIAELERAERDVKADPAVYYALARAYGRAGRTADAARARERFTALTRERDEAARREAAGGVK
jgi:tetratricopeptide (TPR) repeat protein